MAAQHTPLSALKRNAWTTREHMLNAQHMLHGVESRLREADITRALAAAQQAADYANSLVASLTAASVLVSTIDPLDATAIEDARQALTAPLNG